MTLSSSRLFGCAGAGWVGAMVLAAGCGGAAATPPFDDGDASATTGGQGDGASPSSSSSSGGATGSSSGSTPGVDAGSSSSGSSSGSSSSGSSGGSSSSSSSSSGGGGRDAGTDGSVRVDAGVRDAAVADTGTGVVGDSGDPLAAARVQCVQIINADRATLNPPSPPLTEATAAQEACVDGQAQADFAANVAHSAFGQCKENAQDECPGWPGPPSSIMTNCLAQMWAEGPPPAGQDNHWLNMSNSRYTKVACGFYQTPTGSWWATQDFFP